MSEFATGFPRIQGYGRGGRDARAWQAARNFASRSPFGIAGVDEIFDPFDVFDRDGWFCQLCGNAVEPSVPRREPMGATLDHIVPVLAGGRHNRNQTRLAHNRCNLAHQQPRATYGDRAC